MKRCGESLVLGECEEVAWDGLRACYYHMKVRAGLFVTDLAKGDKLTDVERLWVGVGLPASLVPAGRQSVTQRLLKDESRRSTEEAARLRGLRYVMDIGGDRRELHV